MKQNGKFKEDKKFFIKISVLKLIFFFNLFIIFLRKGNN